MWQPLEQYRKHLNILTGLHSRSAEPPPGETGADHWVAAAYLCAQKPRKTAGADVYAGQTIDQIIAAINDLFEGEVTEGDAVSFVETIKTKMMEAPVLRAQAAANTREQFMNSPSLGEELMNAIMDAMAAHQNMSRQALNSDAVRARVLSVLLGPGELWEGLRAEGPAGMPARTIPASA